jgi:nitroreductase
VRHYAPTVVDEATVRSLLFAAVQAPSTLNQQPWAFGVCHGHERLRTYSELAKRHLVETYHPQWEQYLRSELYENPNYDVFHGAGTLIVIYAVSGRMHPTEECCLAAQNLMLAAHGLGLGTCPIGFARPWLDLPETKRRFGVADHLQAVFPLVLGYPALAEPSPGRREPEIACWQWDSP